MLNFLKKTPRNDRLKALQLWEQHQSSKTKSYGRLYDYAESIKFTIPFESIDLFYYNKSRTGVRILTKAKNQLTIENTTPADVTKFQNNYEAWLDLIHHDSMTVGYIEHTP
jgi:hypothetical protein